VHRCRPYGKGTKKLGLPFPPPRRADEARFRDRASALFRAREREFQSELNTLVTGQASKGLLQSGGTIRAALRIFEQGSSRALEQVTSEVAKQIEHRGQRWRSALSGVEASLDAHLSRAKQILTWPVALANSADSDSTREAVDENLERIAEKLRQQLQEFRDGWTSPRPAKWKDRNPIWYAVGMALAGAVITQGARIPAQ
jgi:hypothetical protein